MASGKRPSQVLTEFIDIVSSDDETARPHKIARVGSSLDQPIELDGPDHYIPFEQQVPEPQHQSTDYEDAMSIALKESLHVDQDTCLQRCLEIFPDVADDHVRNLFESYAGHIPSILEQIAASTSYPKRIQLRKEPAGQDLDPERWTRPGREPPRPNIRLTIQQILNMEFPDVPLTFIKETQEDKVQLYATYIAIFEARGKDTPPYRRGRPRNVQTRILGRLRENWGDLGDVEQELQDVRDVCKRMKEEAENFRMARRAGAVTDWYVLSASVGYHL